MRSITVSTDVFARIWALRQAHEDSEDSILRRVLDCPAVAGPPRHDKANTASQWNGGTGFLDNRHGTHFPEGFEIFRKYLGREYRARAHEGTWMLQPTGQTCASLNELSRAIGARTENAWVNWFYRAPDGSKMTIAELRDPSRVANRRRSRPININGGETSDPLKLPAVRDTAYVHDSVTWRDDVVSALNFLYGQASLDKIYKQVEHILRAAGRSRPPTLEAIVRRTLETHSSDSDNFLEGADLFYMPQGKGAGYWGLRPNGKSKRLETIPGSKSHLHM